MVGLCHKLIRLFGHSEDCSKQEDLMGLVRSVRDLLPLSEETIDLRVKIMLLEKCIRELEGKKKTPPGVF